MRLYVTDSYYLPDLQAYLGRYRHAVVTATGANELEVSLLGSFNDEAMRVDIPGSSYARQVIHEK